ncbi:amidase domain-containing protein [Tumebacillus permanentifrigoris]|uniref:Putative amidase-like protein n=1 Tax=Tumebacillus permanentifrigoris TaxID=378543 RepID=A0A316D9F4_9BACL|nr:amidase domain-containing protein [Tumebacillus permanentifrigoris]PWK13821.1 putative amidase-like protein [Tumebacillus permanentifrigoris]
MDKRQWLKTVEAFFREKNRAWLSGEAESMLHDLAGTPADCHSWQEVRAMRDARLHRGDIRYRKTKTSLQIHAANWLPDRELAVVEATEHVRFYYEQGTGLQHEERSIRHRLTLQPVNGEWRVLQDDTLRENGDATFRPDGEAEAVTALAAVDVFDGAPHVETRDARGRYDRVRAYKYAELWWNGYNPVFQQMKGNDCTNYVSQVLYAGGMPLVRGGSRSSGWWYDIGGKHNWSYSWAVAHSLRLALTRVLHAQEVSDPRQLKIGDVICYDWDGDGRWQHNTVVVDFDGGGQPLVNAHTVNSHRRFWTYRDSYAWTPKTKYSFFHIPDQF